MICFKCNLDKDINQFQKHEFLTRGYMDECNSCEAEAMQLYLHRTAKELYISNEALNKRIEYNSKCRTYQANNKDKIKERKRLYYLANRGT